MFLRLIGMTRLLAIASMLFIASPALAVTEIHEEILGIGGLGYVGAPGGASSNSSLSYQHTFDPYFDTGVAISSVDSVWLYIAVIDDSNCKVAKGCTDDWFLESESASITLNQTAWQSGSATARIFYGEVSTEADLMNHGGLLDVTVSSTDGDFVVLWSQLRTTFEYDDVIDGGDGGPTGSSPMPEPSAALAFAIGTLVMRGTVRRRRSG